MVGVFGAGMAMHFNHKGLGLSVEVSRIVFGQSELNYFGQSQDELPNH